jgi:hypothetical protein
MLKMIANRAGRDLPESSASAADAHIKRKSVIIRVIFDLGIDVGWSVNASQYTPANNDRIRFHAV